MSSLTARGTCVALLIGSVVCCVLPGCTEDRPPAQSPTSQHEMIAGAIYIRPSNEPEAVKLADRLTSALTRAGYRVVSSTDGEHELVAELRVALRETSGILKVSVNGQPRKTYEAEATLHVTGGNVLLGAQSIGYDVSDGPSDEQVRQLAATTSGPVVQRYLKQFRQTQKEKAVLQQLREEDAASAQEEEQIAARKERRRQEEASWSQVVLSECSAATQLSGCERVKQYLADYPTGRHTVEAKQALEVGLPLIAKLGDERDWRVAGPEACRAPKATTDCDGVTSYLAAQSAGAHADEARRLLKEAEPKLAAVRNAEARHEKEEEAKADRALARMEQEEKRQNRQACKKRCIRDACFYEKPGRYEICMDRCVKANCE